MLALEFLLLSHKVFERLRGFVGQAQSPCMHQFSKTTGATAFQRERGLFGSILVKGNLGLERVGVEVVFGEGGSGFGVLDGVALGFVDFEGARKVLLGLGVVFPLASEVGKVYKC